LIRHGCAMGNFISWWVSGKHAYEGRGGNFGGNTGNSPATFLLLSIRYGYYSVASPHILSDLRDFPENARPTLNPHSYFPPGPQGPRLVLQRPIDHQQSSRVPDVSMLTISTMHSRSGSLEFVVQGSDRLSPITSIKLFSETTFSVTPERESVCVASDQCRCVNSN
jgi:hypothetical protein